MPDCPELQTILERAGDGEIADSDDEALRAHIEHCSTCQAQLERLGWVPPTVRSISRAATDPDQHPTELQLASFAEHGYSDANARAIIKHLSVCRSCRETVTAAWTSVVRHQNDEDQVPDRPGATVSPLLRLACGFGALVAFAAECVLLAVAVAQFVLAWIVEPVGFQAVPGIWPLTAVSGGAMRFWLLVGLCLIGAFTLRWIAGSLFLCATTGARDGGASG